MTSTLSNIRVLSSAARAAVFPAVEERIGVAVKISRYVRPAYAPATFPLIGTRDEHRIAFALRFDGGLQDFKAVDQAIDAQSALVTEGEQVFVTIVDDVHIADTVRPIWASVDPEHVPNVTKEELDAAEVLREAEYVDGRGRRCVAKLVMLDKQLVCFEEVDA